ncbi:MAG: sulfite reductase subunit alpha [Gluconacetobacter diazotrophicus]|nr:sulfite reductase subunit alpha [Gluconacetobacter diazotrophicus]
MEATTLRRVPFIPDTAPFSEEQRQWLNGFLAGLFSDAAANPAALLGQGTAPTLAAPSAPVLILFGSQTGNAEGLAKKAKAATEKAGGLTPRLLDMAKYDAAALPQETNLLVVTSTWGEGDPPDNAAGFMEKLAAEGFPRLETLRYSVLALGDRNYEDFCGCGRKLDERLAALGARRVLARQDCDTDYDAPAKAWLDAVLPILQKPDGAGEKAETPTTAIGHHDEAKHMDAGAADLVKAGLPVRSQQVPTQNGAAAPAAAYSRTNPFPARLLASRKLTLDGSDKDTRHYEICLKGSGLAYEVGDALGLLPANSPELVQEILDALGFDGEEEVTSHDGANKPLRQALVHDYQIRAPHKEFLAAVSQRDAANTFLRDLLDPNIRTELDQYLYGREIIDFLLDSPKLGFTPGEFVKLLRKLQPRLYSIASSLKAHPEQVHLTVDTLRYDAHGRKRHGVSSTFLADRVKEDTRLPVFVQQAKHFRLPEDRARPVIMVGPGTGIAPFRAFLQERQATGATGGNWLFFGAQKSATDYFYQEELAALQAGGYLPRLDLAFSRDQAEKIYVQTRMQQNAAELWRWLEDGAHFYVCGDAKRMAKDVDDTLHAVVREAGGRSDDAAKEYVAAMKKDKRYQRDVY